LTQLGKSNQFVHQVVDELDKTTEQKINQMIPRGKNVCMKDPRVPTVQLKLLKVFYLTGTVMLVAKAASDRNILAVLIFIVMCPSGKIR